MNESVERCVLAPGFSISRVLTGLWQIADMERDGRELDLSNAAKAMAPYADAGFTTFDMADHYGSAEEVAGLFRAGREHGDQVQLLTKWVPKPGPITRERVRAAIQRSLDRLRAERIDLLQFHVWNYADPRWLDCLYFLQELKDQGLIRHLGLTNFDAAHLSIVVHCGIEVVSNQVCYSMIDHRPAGEMTRLCREHGVKILAYGVLAGGFLSERWLGKPAPDRAGLETWSMMKYRRFIEEAGGWERLQQVLRVLDRVRQKHGVSLSNVASRYILDQPAVGGVIIGARLGQSSHLQDNLRLFGFQLDETDRAEIATVLAKLNPIPGDSGDEYRKPPFLTASGDLSHHFERFDPPYAAQPGAGGRRLVLSGTPWEEIAGYSRAVRHGNRIWVSGTTATHGGKPIGGADPAAQLHFIIDKIEGALQSLGGKLEDVVRTRIFIHNLDDWEAVSRAHGARFGRILPANTLVQARLIGDPYLVEMEADAIVSS